MSEAALIPKVPRISESDPRVAESTTPPASNPPLVVPAEESGKDSAVGSSTISGKGLSITGEGAAVPDTDVTVSNASTTTSGSTKSIDEANGAITPFQGVTYASFILTFCLAGFAAIVIYRKALKTPVKRFSIGAKTLSLAYLSIAFIGCFGTYMYRRFLNGSDTPFPLIIPIFLWIFVGPAIAIALNSLLTREDKPAIKKILFDVFTYLVIFGCIIASQVPSLVGEESLVFSFVGAFFFIVPIIRFSSSLKIAKVFHPELQEMFVQILIRTLLFFPLLLPSLVFANAYELIGGDLALLLFNLVTLVFILMTGLLMIISIDYITQGISADQLVAKQVDIPQTSSDPKPNQPDIPLAQPNEPVASPLPSNPPVTPVVQETPKPVSEKTVKVETKSQAAPVSPKSSTSPANPSIPFKKSSETLEFNVDKHDSTVINFNTAKSSAGKPQEDASTSKNPTLRPLDSKSKSDKKSKKLQLPKAPKSPDTSKASNSKPRVKPPEKPKKRF